MRERESELTARRRHSRAARTLTDGRCHCYAVVTDGATRNVDAEIAPAATTTGIKRQNWLFDQNRKWTTSNLMYYPPCDPICQCLQSNDDAHGNQCQIAAVLVKVVTVLAVDQSIPFSQTLDSRAVPRSLFIARQQ